MFVVKPTLAKKTFKKSLISTPILVLGVCGLAGAVSPAYAQTLEESVISTLNNNPEIGVAFNQYRSRQDSIGVARSGYLPSIDLQAGVGHEESDNPTTRASGDHHKNLTRQELSLNLRQMLFDGFRTTSDVDRATAEALADKFNLQDTAENLALRTAEVYLTTFNNLRIQSLADENLKSHSKIRDKIKLRTDSGIGSSSDLSQVEGRLARANSNLIASENNLLDSETNFIRVVGEAPYQLVKPNNAGQNLPDDVSAAEEIAISEHPVLRAAIADVEAASNNVRFEEGANYPQLSFELGTSANDDLDGTEGHDNDLTAMFRVNYNLYSGGRIKNSIKQAASERAQAKDILMNANREVLEGLRLAWAASDLVGRQLEFLRVHVEQSRKTLDAYTSQFELGRRTLMDLLDMENEVFEAQTAYYNGEKDWLLAQYRILNATGQLMKNLEVTVPELH